MHGKSSCVTMLRHSVTMAKAAVSVAALALAMCGLAAMHGRQSSLRSELGDVTDSFRDKHAAIKLKVPLPVDQWLAPVCA